MTVKLYNSIFVYISFLYAYVLSGLLYIYLNLNILDELVVLVILLWFLCEASNRKQISKLFVGFATISLLFLAYSIKLGLIQKHAIFTDFMQLSKPFLTFVCIYSLRPLLTEKQKYVIHVISILFSILLPVLFLLLSDDQFHNFFFHVNVYGHLMLLNGLVFLYTSKKNKSSILIFYLIITLGLFCTRSKYYGEFVFSIICIQFISSKVRVSIKYIMGGIVACVLIIFATWTKFNNYFVEGLDNEEIARPVLYHTSINIMNDFFPLGSGYGSFAEDASRKYYSPVYDMYGISGVYGLSRDYDAFVADTFFPVIIGQFGLIGIVLFISFWLFIIKRVNRFYVTKKYKLDYNICLIIIVTIIIESIAGPMFVSFMGIPYLFLLALIVSEMRYNYLKYNENALSQ